MKKLIKLLFFALIVRPVVLIVLGLNVRGQSNLPTQGPAVIVSNHNSHLDTIVLMSQFPLSSLTRVRPVGAADYFFKNKLLSWFSKNCIDVVPIDRKSKACSQEDKDKVIADCRRVLEDDGILILYPEGSRGQPGKISELKKGIYHIVKDFNQPLVTPVVMNGLQKALPKGEALLVPFNCDVIIDQPIDHRVHNACSFIGSIRNKFQALLRQCPTYHPEDAFESQKGGQ